MGGDDAPRVPVAAALMAVRDHGVPVAVVGDPPALAAAGRTIRAPGDLGEVPGLQMVAASQVVGMHEDAALAVRAKPDASIRVAMRLLAEGRAAAVVSAGSTGATLAAALLGLGRVPGVRRPVLAVVLPVAGGVVLVDAGASPDIQPEALVAHARLGLAYAAARQVREPTFGLLNVGAEVGKGNELARAAHPLLAGLPGFAGNVEPAAVLGGAVDVVVTDGFTGNVFLKTMEAVAGRGGVIDASGAALLLGVDGVVLVAHGAAGEADLAGALRTARDTARADVVTALRAVLGPTIS
jgi:glycerol-3-phosphate acyltransferase PlsX